MRITLSLLLTLCSLVEGAQPYNVLVVVVDDWGVDFTSQNTSASAKIPKMPKVDSLASAGVRFTEFRTSAQCAQTRASLLTGRYPFRTTVTSVGVALPTTEYTIADDLKSHHSYSTALFGKWNLGGFADGAEQDYPRTRGGFDYFAGSYPVGQYRTPHYATPKTINGGAATTNPSDRYVTTDEADDAIAWIRSASPPWFVELAFHAPHFSGTNSYLYPPTGLQKNFRGTPKTEGGVNAYCAELEALDMELGRVLDVCNLNQTVVVVFGDNGSAFANPPVPSNRIKASGYDNGVHAPLIIRSPGATSVGRKSSVFCNMVDLYPTIVKLATGSSANSSNPLDGQDISGVMRGEVIPLRTQWDSSNIGPTDPRTASDGEYRLYDFTSASDEFYCIRTDPYERSNLGTSSLTGNALKHYNDLRYALTTFTAKTGEQPIVEVNYSTPTVVSGGIQVKKGGTSVVKPVVGSSTITAPLKTGATVYTLWKRINASGSWTDSGISGTIGASTVSFTDPSPVGRVEYRITNNAPEP